MLSQQGSYSPDDALLAFLAAMKLKLFIYSNLVESTRPVVIVSELTYSWRELA